MTQLIIDGLVLPETNHDNYSCYPALLSQEIEMISGRIVREVRGMVQMISYSYDFMGNDTLRALNRVIRSGKAFPVTYLPDDSDEMRSGVFITREQSNPTFFFAHGDQPYWRNVSFLLREVEPHD